MSELFKCARSNSFTIDDQEVKSQAEVRSHKRKQTYLQLRKQSIEQETPMCSDLSQEFLDEMRGVFEVFDVHRTGKLNRADIMLAMRELGEELGSEEVDDMLLVADVDRDGLISFDDFISLTLG
jgi:Ca2+-binding EF-hand superfamily protein